MPLSPIPFGGMESLDADELVPITSALVAENCYIDDATIRPRNGYRGLSSTALGSGGQAQGLWRFRPSLTSARAVAAAGGAIFSYPDPASETTFSTAVIAGTPFGAGAAISAAPLGRYMYFATDEPSVSWVRMKPDYTLETIGTLPQGAPPAISLSSMSVIKLNTLTSPAPVYTSCTAATLFTDYIQIHPTAVPNSATYNFGADLNWDGMGWIAVILTPSTQSGGNGTVTISVSTNTGSYEKLGEIWDSQGNASPCVVFCPTNALTAGTRAAVRKIQFAASNLNDYAVHAVVPMPTAPTTGPQKYRITFQNSATKQESRPTEEVTVVYAGNSVTPPSVHAVRADYNSWRDDHQLTLDPDTIDQSVCWNKGANKDLPSRFDLASIPTFSGNIPAGDQFAAADTVRLWRLTETGWRLVKASPYGTGVTTYSITDDQGDDTLTHELYKAGGTPPQASAMASRAQRLITAYENRVYISSFLATNITTDPYPQFPDIPTEDADGWSFDISAGKDEVIQDLIDGDGLYILTTEKVHVMTDLTPGSVPQELFDRGALGRRAACWAESQLFYASWDGVYTIRNRSEPDELSRGIRRMYFDWLSPDATTVVAYQSRKLYVVCGQRFLRYDFVREVWTRGVINNAFAHAAFFRDPNSRVQNLWFLGSDRKTYRWQPDYAVGSASAALDDAGVAIPAWRYSTGYEFTPVKARVRKIFLDTTGPVQLTVACFAEDRGRTKAFRQPEHELPFAADFTAYKFRVDMQGIGNSLVRRLLWERQVTSGEGARP